MECVPRGASEFVTFEDPVVEWESTQTRPNPADANPSERIPLDTTAARAHDRIMSAERLRKLLAEAAELPLEERAELVPWEEARKQLLGG
jgi:hypothetical protein